MTQEKAPKVIWADPTKAHGWRVGQCSDVPVAKTEVYHHDSVVQELREALEEAVTHLRDGGHHTAAEECRAALAKLDRRET